MSNINCLVPGYTQQQFSLFRSTIYEKAREYVSQEKVGYGIAIATIGTVALLSKTSEYIELPFKVIEDIALTIINLIGAFFKEECRGHLKECGWQLFEDLKSALLPALIIGQVVAIIFMPPASVPLIPLIASIWGASDIILFGLSILSEAINSENMRDYHQIFHYRTESIRTCGYKKVAKLEEEGIYANLTPQQAEERKINRRRFYLSEESHSFFLDFDRLISPKIALAAYRALLEKEKQKQKKTRKS